MVVVEEVLLISNHFAFSLSHHYSKKILIFNYIFTLIFTIITLIIHTFCEWRVLVLEGRLLVDTNDDFECPKIIKLSYLYNIKYVKYIMILILKKY